jgi:hypothetical protein
VKLFKKLDLVKLPKMMGDGPYLDIGTKVLLNILSTAQKLGCQTIIIENEYLDQDYLEEYSAFYCRSFEAYSQKTQRLHFFKEDDITYNDLKNLSIKQYLGYSVVRPIDSYRTGKTVLKSPYNDGNIHFTPCNVIFTTNLSGSNLKIQGTPFIQQDTNVNICAQASIWMASYYMHQKYGCSRFYPPDITRLATRYSFVGPPRVGLHPDQVIIALRDMGYQVARFISNYSLKKDIDEAKILMYSYVKSNFPVILVIKASLEDYHAICVVGYNYNVKFTLSSKSLFFSNIIDHFYYQDDASGPYCTLYKDNPPEDEESFSIKDNVQMIIVPLPKQITLQADDVYRRIPSLLNIDFLNNSISRLFKQKKLNFSRKEFSGLICHFYLRKSSDFKTSLPKEMNNYFQLKYKAMLLPKYIWVVEITKKDLINSPLSKERKIVGEILIDSTADRNDSGPQSYLSIHLYGRMIIRRPPSNLLNLYYGLNEEPYPQLM